MRLLHHAGRRALTLTALLVVSTATTAQSGGGGTVSATGSEAESGSGDYRRIDLKAPLQRPGDDVGGSWNMTLLTGRMTDAAMVDVFVFDFGWDDEYLVSAEVGYTLKEDNPIQKFMNPVLNNIDVAVNFTYQTDPSGPIYEVSPFIMARWNNFPWNDTIRTTFGLGAGLSYASSVPSIELDVTDPDGDYKNLLHYIAIEATLAMPQHKEWQLVYRLHHRSGVFGLMGAENEGNTAVEIGFRYYFK